MLSKNLHDAVNDQIKNETFSAYLYLSMSAYFEAENLPGLAHWVRVQAQEELGHALKFFDYMSARGSRVVLQAIRQPAADFTSPLDVFQKILEHEQKVTGMIHQLYALALKENDYATQVQLQWFVSEQVEEEKTATQIVEQLKAVGDQRGALFMLDAHMGKRE